MKAITIDAPDSPPALRDDLPDPAPAADEVVVRVRASSVNPVDNAIAAGMLVGMFDHDFPIVLGRDYAGVVDQIGANVTGYAVGDEVFGFVTHADPAVHDGTWAELIAVAEDRSIAHKPAGVDLATAGAAPLAGITAMAAVDAVDLSAGDSVLVVGATGGVGSVAVQLAANAGATVIAPAQPEDEDYLRGLGVSELVDRGSDIAAAVRERHPDGVDALLDLVSYAPGAFDAALADAGRLASPLSAAGDGPGRSNVMAVPTTENIERIGALLADGTIRVPVQGTYELAHAADALSALSGTHSQGKLAIEIA